MCSISVEHFEDLVDYHVSLTVMDGSHLLHSINYRTSTDSTDPFLPLYHFTVFSHFSSAVTFLFPFLYLVFFSCLCEDFF